MHWFLLYIYILIFKPKTDKFSIPVPYHFQPMGMQTIFTAVYLKDLTEDELGNQLIIRK